jgi:RNA polymerase sigma-70 factor, ECF subfamily
MKSNREQQIKTLFDDHFHSLVLHAFRFINDYNQSEEIVQDVFVKIWQNYEHIEHNTELKPYLYTAVRNSSLNYLRHLKIRRKYIIEVSDSKESIEYTTEDEMTESEINNRIHEAVNKLPDHWKEAIILSKYDKLKYNEIAEKMNISQKTVEKYVSKALQFLRSELKNLFVAILFFLKFFEKV